MGLRGRVHLYSNEFFAGQAEANAQTGASCRDRIGVKHRAGERSDPRAMVQKSGEERRGLLVGEADEVDQVSGNVATPYVQSATPFDDDGRSSLYILLRQRCLAGVVRRTHRSVARCTHKCV